MDLLTVVMHELGHVLGFEHNASTVAPDVMTHTLGLGVRRLPISVNGQGATATTTTTATSSGTTPAI